MLNACNIYIYMFNMKAVFLTEMSNTYNLNEKKAMGPIFGNLSNASVGIKEWIEEIKQDFAS